MAFLAVVFLHERLDGFEWSGVATLFSGAVLLSVSVPPGTQNTEVIRLPNLMVLLGLLALFAVSAAGVLGVSALHETTGRDRSSLWPDSWHFSWGGLSACQGVFRRLARSTLRSDCLGGVGDAGRLAERTGCVARQLS